MPLDPLELTGGLAIGEGVGGAVADVVIPRLQDFKNSQWAAHQNKPLEAGKAAEVAAEDVDTYDAMQTEASYSGFDVDRFRNLYRVTLTAPGVGELLTMLRREAEVPIDFERGLRKAKLGEQWDAALRNLRHVRIPGPDLAYMVVRGVVANAGTLPSALPTKADRLQLPPQLALDTLAEAAKTGWDAERFAALVARSGLAMAPGLAAQAHFRGILTENDYLLTIARGDLFPAYADPMLDVSRQILTAGEYAELQLRGYYDRATRLENTARHGMSVADSDWLYDVQGRGLSLHGAFISERRGGVFEGPTTDIPAWAMFQLQRGNLRPEVYNLAWAGRETLPSAFVVRALLQGGAITAAQGETLFLHMGWPEGLAAQVADFYGKATAAKADPHVVKADNHVWATMHTSYKNGEVEAPELEDGFALLGVPVEARASVLVRWDYERTLTRKQLTPAQVKKRFAEAEVNTATGQPWTKDETIAVLVARGYSANDANDFLNL